MHQEIRLHGHLDDTIEYFAVMAARDAYSRYFFESTGDALRFFSPGNELVLGRDRYCRNYTRAFKAGAIKVG